VIKSQVAYSEILMYEPDLTSMTSGRGSFTMEFSHYEEVPSHLTEKIVQQTKAQKEEE
jgi:elongation factor G